MPEVKLDEYGIKPRFDGQPGHVTVTPTTIAYYERDGSDVRLDRVKVYNGEGCFVRSYLMDKMGSPYVDNWREASDDLSYLLKLQTRQYSLLVCNLNSTDD